MGEPRDLPRVVMQIVVSLIFIVLGAWIVLRNSNADLQKVACGWLGLILGYWLS